MQCLGTPTQNKYSDGFPGRRVYTGTDIIDKIEELANNRAFRLFNLSPEVWEVNTQVLSGSVANMLAYSAVLSVGDPVLAMDPELGGHLSYGHKANGKIISHSAKFYDWEHYGVDEQGWIDYDQLEQVVSARF